MKKLRLLLAAGDPAAILARRDFDGHSAATVAQLHLHGRSSAAEILRMLGAGAAWTAEEHRERLRAWILAQRARIDEVSLTSGRRREFHELRNLRLVGMLQRPSEYRFFFHSI